MHSSSKWLRPAVVGISKFIFATIYFDNWVFLKTFNFHVPFTLGDCLQMWRHRELDWDDVDCNDGGSENKPICQIFS